MVLSMRFERMTCSLGGSRSIQLSYESMTIELSYNIAVHWLKVKHLY